MPRRPRPVPGGPRESPRQRLEVYRQPGGGGYRVRGDGDRRQSPTYFVRDNGPASTWPTPTTLRPFPAAPRSAEIRGATASASPRWNGSSGAMAAGSGRKVNREGSYILLYSGHRHGHLNYRRLLITEFSRLLKNSHLAAVLESRRVRRSAATSPNPSPSGRGQGMLSPSGGEIERGSLRGAFCGCDDLTVFEQPEFFNNLLGSR